MEIDLSAAIALKRQSFLTCKHMHMQQFTECCMDCGYNVWTTKAEYLEQLRKEVMGVEEAKRQAEEARVIAEIYKLEDRLGISR